MTEKMTGEALRASWAGHDDTSLAAWDRLADDWNALLARAEKAEAEATCQLGQTRTDNGNLLAALAERDAEVARLRKIIARNDTTTSYKCSYCGSYHLRAVEDKDGPGAEDGPWAEGWAKRANPPAPAEAKAWHVPCDHGYAPHTDCPTCTPPAPLSEERVETKEEIWTRVARKHLSGYGWTDGELDWCQRLIRAEIASAKGKLP